jgi:osmotically-inducible protein OsmY
MKPFNKILPQLFWPFRWGPSSDARRRTHQQGTGEYIDDTVITTKVKALLIEDPLTKALEINVNTFKGVVQFSGFVSSRAERTKAIELARGVKGVTSVKNDMQIK